MSNDRIQISVCSGTGCMDSGSVAVREALDDQIRSQGLEKTIEVMYGPCPGYCATGPLVTVQLNRL